MIDSVRIENFRGFESAQVDDLGRVNILVGDNRVGKTAFLEALFLVAGNTIENHLKELLWRGLLQRPDQVTVSDAAIRSGALWRDLFFRFDQKRTITIAVQGRPSRSLSIVREDPPEISVLPGPDDVMSVEAPLVFTWKDDKGNMYPSRPRFVASKGLVAAKVPPGIEGAMIADTPILADDAAGRFSNLDIQGKAQAIVEAIRRHFQEIEGLSTQPNPPVGSMLYVTLHGMSEKIPLPMLSAGINRWIYLLCTIDTFPGGAVYVDEVEKGIYHQRLPGFWQSIFNSSARSGTQVFASTHSLECLTAAQPCIESEPDAFRLLRLRHGGKIERLHSRQVIAALKEGFEVR